MRSIILIFNLFVVRCLARESKDVTVKIDEELPIGSIIYNISHVSKNAKLYRIVPTTRSNLTEVKDGIVKIKSRIDREELCQEKKECTIKITLYDKLGGRILHINFSVEDINDNPPRFEKITTTLNIMESDAIGSKYSLPVLTDLDYNYSANYNISLNGNNQSKFGLIESGIENGYAKTSLILNQGLDREEQDHYELTVRVTDADVPNSVSTLRIIINVIDANDNSPIFEKPFYNFSIIMPNESNIILGRVKAHDIDLGENGKVTYKIAAINRHFSQYFSLNESSGLLQVSVKNWCAFPTTHLNLNITATDGGIKPLQDFTLVEVKIKKFNCFSPEIQLTQSYDDLTLLRNDLAGTLVTFINILDKDDNNVECHLDSKFLKLARLKANFYELSTAVELNNKTIEEIRFEINCSDDGNPILNATEIFTITIIDLNDNDPIFKFNIYTFSVQENNLIPSFIGSVQAVDGDRGKNAELEYFLLNPTNIFSVNNNSGDLLVLESLDYEKDQQFRIIIVARDHGEPSRSSNVTVIINVININDCIPMFEKSYYNMTLHENLPGNTFVGSLEISDEDGPSPNKAAIVVQLGMQQIFNDYFILDKENGTIVAKVPMDREIYSSFSFIISVYDVDSNISNSSAELLVTVLDVNDNYPNIYLPNDTILNISQSLLPGSFITQIQATDDDIMDNAELIYTIDEASNHSSYFFINNVTGQIYSSSFLPDGAHLILECIVYDKGDPPLSSSITLQLLMTNYSLAVVDTYDKILIFDYLPAVIFFLIILIVLLLTAFILRKRKKPTVPNESIN